MNRREFFESLNWVRLSEPTKVYEILKDELEINGRPAAVQLESGGFALVLNLNGEILPCGCAPTMEMCSACEVYFKRAVSYAHLWSGES